MKSQYAVGSKAPAFSLKTSEGNTISLKQFLGKKNVLLIFYPGDDTPGCTAQLCSIRDDYKTFQKTNTVVFGVNHADKDSHNHFIKKFGFQFPLLIDKDRKVSKKYGAIKYMFGRESIRRSVVLIDKKGKFAYVKRGMPEDKEILAQLIG
ncbi:peroxiredoxin [Candidatus Falkowbacteria bacterium]|nr:peroxiredoxin [Candidatus Falkowbacteria bacterium]